MAAAAATTEPEPASLSYVAGLLALWADAAPRSRPYSSLSGLRRRCC